VILLLSAADDDGCLRILQQFGTYSINHAKQDFVLYIL